MDIAIYVSAYCDVNNNGVGYPVHAPNVVYACGGRGIKSKGRSAVAEESDVVRAKRVGGWESVGSEGSTRPRRNISGFVISSLF